MDINDLDFGKGVSGKRIDDFNRFSRLLCSVSDTFIPDMEELIRNVDGLLDEYCMHMENGGVDHYYKVISVEDCSASRVHCRCYELKFTDGEPYISDNRSAVLDGDGVIRMFFIRDVVTHRISVNDYMEKYAEFIRKYYHIGHEGERLLMRDLYECDFCRSICKGLLKCEPCSEAYNNDVRSHMPRQRVKCLGSYCDKPCDLIDVNEGRNIKLDVFANTIRMLVRNMPKRK